MQLSILSNINVDPIINKIKKIYKTDFSSGYGNVLADLLNPSSFTNDKETQAVFIVIDLDTLLEYDNIYNYEKIIDDFISQLITSFKTDKLYFISDGYTKSSVIYSYKTINLYKLAESYWNSKIYNLVNDYKNIFIFPYSNNIRMLGENQFFYPKTWYIGSLKFTNNAIKLLVQTINQIISTMLGNIKKVIVLDLDNTMWGGIIGEDGIDNILLDNSGIGKVYKDIQYILHNLKNYGTLLTIVSKNNEVDALNVINNHPEMVLKESDFISYKINWKPKYENILELSKELNLGLSSFVFIDDNPVERESVKQFCPEVTVPDFPDNEEDLLQFIENIANEYFTKLYITEEDINKTKQYKAKLQYDSEASTVGSFDDFLKGLNIKVSSQLPSENQERLIQLLQKTNQFNLTVNRFSTHEVASMINNQNYHLYMFKIDDRFTSHGICAAVIVKNIDNSSVHIENFVMSCRVMGKNIEYGILNYIVNNLCNKNIQNIYAKFIRGEKNQPVAQFYEQAGFTKIEDTDISKSYVFKAGINSIPNIFYGEYE